MDKIFKEIEKNLDYYAGVVARKSNIEKEDARQEICERLIIAYKVYKKNMSALKTFFITVMQSHAMYLIKKSYNNKNNFLKEMKSIDKEMDNFKFDISESRKQLDMIERIEDGTILDEIENKLQGTAKEIFRLMRYYSTDLSDLQDVLHESKQNICNIIRRKIRPVIKKAGVFNQIPVKNGARAKRCV